MIDVGDHVARARDDQRIGALASLPREAVLAASPENRLIPRGRILKAVLKRGWFGNCKLTLELIDGTTETFAWKRIYNDPDEAAMILRRGLGLTLQG